MKLLDRYLFGQFARNFLLVLCSLIAIYLLVDFFERVDNFLAAGKPVGLAVKYLILKMPLIYEQLVPVGILLAGVITLGVLNHSHELMALTAGGICVRRIIRPLLAAAAFFTLLTLAAAQWLLPPTVTATNRIWYVEVNRQIPRGVVRNGRTYFRGDQGIYSFVRPETDKNRFTNFSYVTLDDPVRPALLLSARTARWKHGRWFFHQGQRKTAGPGDSDYSVTLFDDFSLNLPESPGDFFIPPYKTAEKSLLGLLEDARVQAAARHDGLARLEFHKQLSYIFLGFPLILVGLPVLLIMHQGRGRDLALAITVSCGMAFLAWGWWSASQALAKAGYLHPAAASWSIHLLAGSIGIFLIRRLDT